MIRWLVQHLDSKKESANAEIIPILADFIATLSPTSQTSYRATLRDFEQFLVHKKKNLYTALPLHADLYIKNLLLRDGIKSRGQLKSNKISKKTVYKYIVILKKLYDVLIENKAFNNVNPFLRHIQEKSKYHTLEKRPTEMLNFDLVMRLINLPDKSTKRGKRDRAILSLLFGAGLRRGEVLKLNIDDLSYNGDGFDIRLINTKNGSDVIQPISSFFNEAIFDYLNQRRKEVENVSLPLFVDYYRDDGRASNKYLNPSTLRNMFKKYAETLGISNLTPHSARATAISKLLEDGLKHE